MPVDQILKLLQSLGLSPLEILTVIGLVVVYRKNEALYSQVIRLQESLDACLSKISPQK